MCLFLDVVHDCLNSTGQRARQIFTLCVWFVVHVHAQHKCKNMKFNIIYFFVNLSQYVTQIGVHKGMARSPNS